MTLRKEPATDGLARTLRTLRASRRISQGALAAAAGIQTKMISHYENGLSVPNLETARKIAEVLGVAIDVFYADSIPLVQSSGLPE